MIKRGAALLTNTIGGGQRNFARHDEIKITYIFFTGASERMGEGVERQ